MKITDIKPYPVWVGHRNQLIVKVETELGWKSASHRQKTLDAMMTICSLCNTNLTVLLYQYQTVPVWVSKLMKNS